MDEREHLRDVAEREAVADMVADLMHDGVAEWEAEALAWQQVADNRRSLGPDWCLYE